MEAQNDQAETLLNMIDTLILANDADSPSTVKSNRDSPLPLDEVEAILGYEFKNKHLLKEAFTHHSYNVENYISYERLKYIGKAVFNLLIKKEQFLCYPNFEPGQMTRLRDVNVDTEKLARVIIENGLHLYLRHKKPHLEEQIQEFKKAISDHPLHSNGLIDVPKGLVDIVESSIGAVFVDCGFSFDFVWKIFQSILEPIIDPNTTQKHPITELNENCQKRNLKVEFVDFQEETMSFNVLINEELFGCAVYGTKKQIAQGRAARNYLHKSTNKDAIVD